MILRYVVRYIKIQIMNKLIYLDTNVFIDAMDTDRKHHDALNLKLNSLSEKFIFPYSPAHIEELWNILIDESDQKKAQLYLKQHIEYISTLSSDIEILPSLTEIIIKNEHPSICLNRVKLDYDSTLFAEFQEEFNQAFRDKISYQEFFSNSNNEDRLHQLLLGNYPNYKNLVLNELNKKLTIFRENNDKLKINPNALSEVFSDFQNKYNIDKRIIGTLSSSEIFSNDSIINLIHNEYPTLNLSRKYKEISSSHREIEKIITELLTILEVVGYKAEGRNKSRSRMHDNTHAIYATKADYFIIGDKKYRQKVKAVYEHLQVSTMILSVTEFIEYNFFGNR